MRVSIGWIGMALPLVEIGEAIAVGILLEHVAIGDRQAELLKPFVRYRRMHFRRVQSCRLAVSADEMLLRNEQPGTSAKRPLWRLAQLLRCRFHRHCFSRRRRGQLRRARLRCREMFVEMYCPVENPDPGKQQDCGGNDECDAFVILPHPVYHGVKLTISTRAETSMCSFPTMKFKAAGGEAELVGPGVAVVFAAEFAPGFAVSVVPVSRGGPFPF